MSCCFPKCRKSKREDRYKVKEEDSAPAPPEVRVDPPEPVFSWDKRENVDLSHYTVANIHGESHKREGNTKDAMQIENCSEASVFLLKTTASLTIDDCRDCLLILGPCSGSVFIRDCTNCIILTACQQLRLRDCHNVKIAILCPTQPIIENSDDIHFHPLALFYEDFKNQMCESGLSLFTNRVKTAHDFTPEGNRKNFLMHGGFVSIDEKYLEVMTKENISVETAKSSLPVFKPPSVTKKELPIFIYSIRETDESRDDFSERICTFTEILKDVQDLNLLDSYDIETKNIDKSILPVDGSYDNIILFEMVGELSKLQEVCKENFDIFKVLDESKMEQVTKLLKAHRAKND
ncbi:unnamed protein product [Caenorhabditis angaria]|uniref:Protein XRP2 n=1 Tax=Caenorhabditis angaria TaxID=860376 RepID=A0A9P1IP49_9PELO|nr:unnamed protein product [Caenorhabditis angaria]